MGTNHTHSLHRHPDGATPKLHNIVQVFADDMAHVPRPVPTHTRAPENSGGGAGEVSGLPFWIFLPAVIVVCTLLRRLLQDYFGWTFWHAAAAAIGLAGLLGLIYGVILRAIGKRGSSN
jgi:hypothetical protein